MARTKQTLRRAPLYDPHVAIVATMGRIIVEEETAQPPGEAEPKVITSGLVGGVCCEIPRKNCRVHSEASLRIEPRGSVSDRPTCPVPTTRVKSKAIVVSSDSSSSNDDGMSSRMRGLTGGPSEEPTGQVRAKVAWTSSSVDASGPSLPPPPLGPAPAGQPIVQPTDQGTRRPRRGVGSATGKKVAESATQPLFISLALYKLGGNGVVYMWLSALGIHTRFWLSMSSAHDHYRGSSDAFQERVKVLEESVAAKIKANAELEVLLAEK
uniref:Uncharacterized protein n=1 Tax=Cannabis sativa TaxID=3483 RepID=A0A803QNE8_CANSA